MSSCTPRPGRGTALKNELLQSRAGLIRELVGSFDGIRSQFVRDMELAIPWFVSYVLTLGASGRHHHSGVAGLLDHSLRVASSASREARSRFQDHPFKDALVYMATLWGLFHDLGKRTSCALKCSRCASPLGTGTLEEFLNWHEWGGERLPYEPQESCLHTEASRRFFIEWLDRRFLMLPDEILRMIHSHYGGHPQDDLAWIDQTVHKLNGSDGTENKLQIHRDKILPLLADGNAPDAFEIAPYYYVLVAATLHKIVRHGMPGPAKGAGKLDYFVLPGFIGLNFADLGALLALMRHYYREQHGELRRKDFKRWDLVDELYREGSLLALGPGRRALVKGRVIIKAVTFEVPCSLVLLRRSIDGLVILPGAPLFSLPIVFEAPRPPGVPERFDPPHPNSS
jgi:hypothetical protein